MSNIQRVLGYGFSHPVQLFFCTHCLHCTH